MRSSTARNRRGLALLVALAVGGTASPVAAQPADDRPAPEAPAADEVAPETSPDDPDDPDDTAVPDPAEPAPTQPSEPSEPEPQPVESEPADTAPARKPGELTAQELAERDKALRIQQARDHYTKGNAAYDRGDYAEAAEEYELSFAAVNAGVALYNAALSHERSGQPVKAIRALKRYLDLPDCSELPPQNAILCTDERPKAERALGAQLRLVGTLRLSFSEPVDVREVRVAGRTVPLDDFPVYLLPGAVDVELFGTAPNQKREWVAYMRPGESFTISITPFDDEAVVAPPELPPDRGGPDPARQRRIQRGLRTSFWAGVGLTGASTVALSVMGGLTLYEQRTHDREKCKTSCVDENGEPLLTGYPLDHRGDFERYKPITNALVGVTIGVAVATALVGAFAFRNREQAEGADGRRASRRARRFGRVQAYGLGLRW